MAGIFDRRTVWLHGLALLLLVSGALGCTRCHFFRHADEDAYGILEQKLRRTPWRTPSGYSVMPDPRRGFLIPRTWWTLRFPVAGRR